MARPSAKKQSAELAELVSSSALIETAQGKAALSAALASGNAPLIAQAVLELVGGDHRSDAEAALDALSIHRYDGQLVEELERRTASSRELAQRFKELFVDGPRRR